MIRSIVLYLFRWWDGLQLARATQIGQISSPRQPKIKIEIKID